MESGSEVRMVRPSAIIASDINGIERQAEIACSPKGSALNSERSDDMAERMADIAVLGAEVCRLEAVNSDLNKKIEAFKADLLRDDEVGLNASDADLTIGELSRQLDIRDRTIADLQVDRDRLLKLVEDVFSTTSWKLTAPLRKLKSIFRQSPPSS